MSARTRGHFYWGLLIGSVLGLFLAGCGDMVSYYKADATVADAGKQCWDIHLELNQKQEPYFKQLAETGHKEEAKAQRDKWRPKIDRIGLACNVMTTGAREALKAGPLLERQTLRKAAIISFVGRTAAWIAEATAAFTEVGVEFMKGAQ